MKTNAKFTTAWLLLIFLGVSVSSSALAPEFDTQSVILYYLREPAYPDISMYRTLSQAVCRLDALPPDINRSDVLYCSIPAIADNIRTDYLGIFETLRSIGADRYNQRWHTSGGMLIDGKTNTVCAYPRAKIGGITIPAEAEHIGNYVFFGQRGLGEVLIPPTIKSIGESAFATSEITLLRLCSENIEIGADAFASCPNLETVIYPGKFEYGFEFIHSPVFFDLVPAFMLDGTVLIRYSGHGSEITIPDGVTEIASAAFDEVIYGHNVGEKIIGVYVPDSVVKINSRAFFASYALEWVSVPANTEIAPDAFAECEPGLKIIVRSDSDFT